MGRLPVTGDERLGNFSWSAEEGPVSLRGGVGGEDGVGVGVPGG